MINRSDIDLSEKRFATYDEAVKEARKIRNRSEWFEDYEAEDGDDLPPYDSASMQNWDNDEELLIRVMKESEIDAEVEDNHEYMRSARDRAQLGAALEKELARVQIQQSGGRVLLFTLPGVSSIGRV